MPSICAIITLWEVSRHVVHSQMFANIHWFLRPAELARTRTKREHQEARGTVVHSHFSISLNLRVIFCTRMRSIYPLMPPRSSTFLPSSPIVTCVRPRNKSKAPLFARYKSHVSTMTNSFFCVNAVDSRRGLYYELDWHAHRKRSLEHAEEDGGQWGSGAP